MSKVIPMYPEMYDETANLSAQGQELKEKFEDLNGDITLSDDERTFLIESMKWLKTQEDTHAFFEHMEEIETQEAVASKQENFKAYFDLLELMKKENEIELNSIRQSIEEDDKLAWTEKLNHTKQSVSESLAWELWDSYSLAA